MLCYGDLATATLFLCVTCFRHVSAFVPTAGLHSSNNRDRNRIHRIQPSTSSGRPQGLLMRGTQLPEEEEERSSSKNRKGGFKRTIDHDNRELTRLDFGRRVGLGFAAGAALLLDAGGSKHALAEDTAPTSAAEGAGDAAAPTVAETAPVASETVVATPTSTSAAGRPGMPPLRDMGIEIPYIGKPVPLNKFLGSKATLVVNPKLDDPESLQQMPGISKLASEYSSQGLNVLLFPTEQGTFEADEDRVVRIKFYQFYAFGQYPKAVVFDKVDIVGSTIHPFYRYLCRSLKNPNGIARVTLNYEKFLLDGNGHVVRRYPRKLKAADFEEDVKAVLADKPLPAESRDFKLSWIKADQEALKSEYAFKLGLNYYNN